MKRCPNPDCRSEFFFGDTKTRCPFCHSVLVQDTAPAASPRVSLPLSPLVSPPQAQAEPVFMQHGRGGITCTGRVLELDHQAVFYSRAHKLFNALVRGEPYQFAHQTLEYTVRVESITDGVPSEVTYFCLYGNCLGRIQIGDEVRIRAKEQGGRRVVKSIYNLTTGSEVKPGLQLSATAIWLTLGLLAALLAALACTVVYLFRSGAVAAFLLALLTACMPLFIMLIGFWILFQSVFPNRRRRR